MNHEFRESEGFGHGAFPVVSSWYERLLSSESYPRASSLPRFSLKHFNFARVRRLYQRAAQLAIPANFRDNNGLSYPSRKD